MEKLRTLIEAREAAGTTITAMAREAGVPQPVLYRFWKGEQTLNLTTAEKLMDYFDLELVPRKRKPSKPE
jgi:predicted transcriptional regulator